MPVRSSSSSVLAWPSRERVDREARGWARVVAAEHPEILAVGYFGSYARGDQGVGSDLDLVVLIRPTEVAAAHRTRAWPLERLPVPAEALVYTLGELDALARAGGRFYRTLADETVWIFRREGEALPETVAEDPSAA